MNVGITKEEVLGERELDSPLKSACDTQLLATRKQVFKVRSYQTEVKVCDHYSDAAPSSNNAFLYGSLVLGAHTMRNQK